jgi:uncharacterized protein (UPF0548 family)
MMVSLRRPSTETIREFLASQLKLGFTYTAVGATASLPPAGYTVDHTRIKLGDGEEVFTKAKAALGRWEQFRLGWVEAWSPTATIETGDVVAVIARNLGLWWLSACRIVYVVDEEEPIQRYGFAYGTLPDHARAYASQWDVSASQVKSSRASQQWSCTFFKHFWYLLGQGSHIQVVKDDTHDGQYRDQAPFAFQGSGLCPRALRRASRSSTRPW